MVEKVREYELDQVVRTAALIEEERRSCKNISDCVQKKLAQRTGMQFGLLRVTYDRRSRGTQEASFDNYPEVHVIWQISIEM